MSTGVSLERLSSRACGCRLGVLRDYTKEGTTVPSTHGPSPPPLVIWVKRGLQPCGKRHPNTFTHLFVSPKAFFFALAHFQGYYKLGTYPHHPRPLSTITRFSTNPPRKSTPQTRFATTPAMSHSYNSSFSTMASMRTPSELSYDLNTDLFTDFDGAYIVEEDEWDRSVISTKDGQPDPRAASKNDLVDGDPRCDSLGSTVAGDGGGRTPAWRIRKVCRWLVRMVRCW
ncbi:hypothetical protein P3342_009329 [Pyrenophora teres f. teres]|nr:hypothetical protein P3342_009329 [Pyrenophora teres f. teres]